MSVWLKPDKDIPSSGTALAGERSQLPEVGIVFCDWLSVTFEPTESLDWLDGFIRSIGGQSIDDGKYTTEGGGFIRRQIAKRWQSLSFSGSALAAIRSYGLFEDLLYHIAQQPHKVTRLDAAIDYALDAAPIVNRLWSAYQSGGVRLNVWNEITTRSFLSARFDGAITGTFYAGDRRVNKVTARVYDKQHQVYDLTKVDIGSRVRYELTVKTDQVNLRDVSQPSAVFWHYMNPALLKSPDDVDKWEPGNPYVWASREGLKPVLSDEERLHRVVYVTGDLTAAIAMCGTSIHMFDMLLKLVRLRILGASSKLDGWRPSYDS